MRVQSKLYLFNSCGMLSMYIIVAIPNFVFRIVELREGHCIIGMKSQAMIPLISFDAIANVYLTLLFLIPLSKLYTFKNMARTPANRRLRIVAVRTFVGAFSDGSNLTVLTALNGEPGWVCLMCCNCDILFSALIIQWVTSRDNAGAMSSTASSSHRAPIPPDCITPSSTRLATPRNYATRSLLTMDDVSAPSSPQTPFSRDCSTDGPGDPTVLGEAIPTARIRHQGEPNIPSAYDRKARRSGDVRFAEYPPPLKPSCGTPTPDNHRVPKPAATGTLVAEPLGDVGSKSSHPLPDP
ncbi:hypothetical protein JDV02_006250 [Purpureocillium takamizusanense]|uniref:Uncharacterized protein n=1 Tax=Purpureocillium takamizusanense TaxID=2060973 RepID=A0A9Q8VCT2_9HYPO|nr:uncharacterized protein JDV02_006250 [Purpureocillium takamizusanense]UNI20132.1 hypothetical protein JDV02_006250 [Purpureocillium takamizusanense]